MSDVTPHCQKAGQNFGLVQKLRKAKLLDIDIL